MLIMISYDLKAPGRDYGSLYAAIKRTGTAWWHYLQSTWIVEVANNVTITDVNERLRCHIDQNDRLIISKLVRPYDGWLTQEAWDWINARVGG